MKNKEYFYEVHSDRENSINMDQIVTIVVPDYGIYLISITYVCFYHICCYIILL